MVSIDLADELVIDEGGTGSSSWTSGRGPGIAAAACRPGQPGHAGRSAAVRSPCRGAPDQADPCRRRAWAAARPTPPPCCAGPAATDARRGGRARCRRALLRAGGRARVDGTGRAGGAAALRGPRLRPAAAAARRRHRRRLPAPGTRQAAATQGPTRRRLAAAALAIEPRAWPALARRAGPRRRARRRVLAGSGSTWFVEGGPARGRARRNGPSCGWVAGRAGWCGARTVPAGWDGRLREDWWVWSAYFPARRCQRVAFSIFLCFFLRMRLRRFLISDPMSVRQASGLAAADCQVAPDSGRRQAMGFEIVGLDHVQLAMPPGREDEARGLLQRSVGARAPAQAGPPRRPGRLLVRPGRPRPCTWASRRTSARPARPTRPSSCATWPTWRRRSARRGSTCGPTLTASPGRAPTWTTPSGTASNSWRAQGKAVGRPTRRRHFCSASSGAATVGRLRDKRAPPAGSFSATTVPPSALTTCATMASPRPEPGSPRADRER